MLTPDILENHLRQFEDRFAALTNQQRCFLRTRLFERYVQNKDVQIIDEDIILMCRRLGVDHADIVLSVSDITDASTLETLIGRPIVRERPTTPTQRRTRSRTIRSDPRVIIAVVDNPKKPGSKSFDRFEFYRVGMTVDEYYAASGGTSADIRYDTNHGFIKLETKS